MGIVSSSEEGKVEIKRPEFLLVNPKFKQGETNLSKPYDFCINYYTEWIYRDNTEGIKDTEYILYITLDKNVLQPHLITDTNEKFPTEATVFQGDKFLFSIDDPMIIKNLYYDETKLNIPPHGCAEIIQHDDRILFGLRRIELHVLNMLPS